MWACLSILHSNSEGRSGAALPAYFLWQTCMRNVYVSDLRLLPQVSVKIKADFASYQGYRAYEFLLEMVLGLHSDLIGETQVFHQFRNSFLRPNSVPPLLSSYLEKLRMDITADARRIRSRYMNGLGELSYGGVARRLLKERAPWRITLLGSGQLACELIPWLIKDKHSIQVLGRNLKKLKEMEEKFPLRAFHYKDLSRKTFDSHSALLVAAPLALGPYLAFCKQGTRILDFRGGQQEDLKIPPELEYYSLKDITSFILQSRGKRERLFQQLQPKIKELVSLRKAQEYQFAQTWDELSSLCLV